MNIIKQVVKDMPQGLDDLGRARYVYLKLGLIFNFNTTFNNTTDERFSYIYSGSANINHLSSNQVICRLWAKIYSETLNFLGIENYIVDYGHQYVRFKYNNKWWIAEAADKNCYSDLARIRYGDKTEKFGVAMFQNSDKNTSINKNDSDMELLDNIDKQVPFYQRRVAQFNDLNKKLSLLNGNSMSTSDKVDFMFRTMGTLCDGYYEAKDFVRELEGRYLTREELLKIHAVELKRTNKNYDVDIVQCIYVYENGKYSYYLLAPNLPIKKVISTQITKLATLGYGIEKEDIGPDNPSSREPIPGVDYPRKFRRGERYNRFEKYVLTRFGLSHDYSEIYPYDVVQKGKLKR